MRITINAFGSRGDVQPYVALGKGLKAAGHQVLLHTHRLFEELVLDHGLDLFPIELNPKEVLISQTVADLGNNPLRVSRWIADNFRPVLDEVFRQTLAAAQGADLILNSTLSFAGYHVAEKLDIPAIAVFLQPATPTREFPASTIALPPAWLPFKGLYNYLATKFSNQSFFYLTRGMSNDCRAEILDLPPLGMGYYWGVDSPDAEVLILYGYSPAVVPKPHDWGPNQQVTGYWFLETKPDYEPSARLVEFLNEGSRPVYIGFGSMVDHEKEAMSQLVIEAVAQSGQRALLLGGWSELGAAALPDTILRLEAVPHDWLFPQVAAVVHHGGAGTTAAGLRAGVPSVVVPFFGDQYFWGWRVHELGVGPHWIPRKELTAANLAQAIRQAVHDEEILRRAASLGSTIRAEDGVGMAVQTIESYLSSTKFMTFVRLTRG